MIDLFGFADQEKVTFGLRNTPTLKRNNNNGPSIRTAGVDAAKNVIKDIGWHFLNYPPSLEHQHIMTDQLPKKDPTELYYKERIVFRKDVNANNISDL